MNKKVIYSYKKILTKIVIIQCAQPSAQFGVQNLVSTI